MLSFSAGANLQMSSANLGFVIKLPSHLYRIVGFVGVGAS